MSSRGRTIAGVVALALLLLLYVGLVGQRAFALMGTGDAVGIVLGVAILVIPLLVVWFLVRELAQARAVDRLTRLLQTEGGLQIDDLPRSPGGRIDKAVAAERFDDAREGVESARMTGAVGITWGGPTTPRGTAAGHAVRCGPRCVWNGPRGGLAPRRWAASR